MDKFKIEDFKVGDFIYYDDEKLYRIAKLTRITETEDDFRLWGYWSGNIDKLPETIEEFEVLEINGMEKYISMLDIAGILKFSNETILKNNSFSILKYLSNVDGYDSSTQIALNEMLKAEFDIEDLLRVLIPSVVHRLKETKVLEISE